MPSAIRVIDDHGELVGLGDDDHTQYALLAGRAGGQTLYGGAAASENLTLESTSDATKGHILLNPNGGNVGIGTPSPEAKLDIAGTDKTSLEAPLHIRGAYTPAGQNSRWPFLIADYDDTTPSRVIIGFSNDSNVDTLLNLTLAPSSKFRFIKGGNLANTLVVVDSSGNVGIGTTGPGAKLQIDTQAATTVGAIIKGAASQSADLLQIQDSSANKLVVVDANGNVGIGTTTPGGGTTAGTKVLSIADGTAPVGGVASQVSLYSSSGELYVLDAAGNATLLSPHDPVTGEWVFYSKNTATGRILRVNMERLVRRLEKLTGERFIEEFFEEAA